MLKKLLVIFLIFSFSQAELIYESWHQKTVLSSTEIKTEVNLTLVSAAPANSYYNSWSYVFDPSRKITLQEVRLNDQAAQYEFINNNLTINLNKLFNNQRANIQIKYTISDPDQNPYLVKQYASLPKWARTAKGSLEVSIPDNYLACAEPPDFTKSFATYYWSGDIPENGLDILFQYTPKNIRWKFVQKIKLTGSGTQLGYQFELPTYFQTGDSQLENFAISCSPPEKNRITSGNYNIFQFLAGENTITITAELQRGNNFENYKLPLKKDFLYLSGKYSGILKTLAQNILRKKSNQSDYIRLADWVHDYITYDYGYTGRKMTIQQILNVRKGVCEHYSQLYLSLCRAIDIPAVEVSGYAYSIDTASAPPGWGPHSWVLVFVNNKWLPIDPTWDLTSGIIPVSHIGFYYTYNTPYAYLTRNTSGRILVDDRDLSISEIK